MLWHELGGIYVITEKQLADLQKLVEGAKVEKLIQAIKTQELVIDVRQNASKK